MPECWMTIKDVAEYLQLSIDLVYKMAQVGKSLPPRSACSGGSNGRRLMNGQRRSDQAVSRTTRTLT